MAAAIMISTFGTINALTLTGPRVYYAMARQRLFFPFAGTLNAANVPGASLALQGLWAVLLVLPRAYDPATRTWGNLYSDLLEYVISAALIFCVLTVSAVFRLRVTRPDASRPYRTLGYPVVPAFYVGSNCSNPSEERLPAWNRRRPPAMRRRGRIRRVRK